MHRLVSLLLSLFFGCTVLLAQSIDTLKLDSLMYALEKYNRSMGTLIISKNNSVVYKRSIGYNFDSIKGKTKLDEESRYRIGSITKMFTAVLIFQLIEENRLSLNTPLSDFFPALPNATKITIADMLSHRSGLYNYTKDWDSWRFRYNSPEQLQSFIASKQPEFDPGTKTSYSNTNYLLLGYIIEKLSGKPYTQVLKERITMKAGLNNTYYGEKIGTFKKEVASYGYETSSWIKQPETDMSAGGGAGAIVSTGPDLVKFINLLFTGNLVSKKSLAQMLIVKDGEGMGIEQLPFYDMAIYGHSGWIDFFQSWLLYSPKDSIAIVYLSNGYGGVTINDILKGILHISFNKPYVIPDYKPIVLSEQELQQYVGNYRCDQPAINVVITSKNGSLYAQATGQSAFPLEPTEKDHFKYDGAGVRIEFSIEKKEFILKQGNGSYLFKRM